MYIIFYLFYLQVYNLNKDNQAEGSKYFQLALIICLFKVALLFIFITWLSVSAGLMLDWIIII